MSIDKRSKLVARGNRVRLSVLLLVALLLARDGRANPCVDGRCPVPTRPQGSRVAAEPAPQLRTATCRILHETGRGRSWGSGSVVQIDASECLVLTCAHLFRDGAGTTRLWFADGTEHTAQLLARDVGADLAALRVDADLTSRARRLGSTDPSAGQLLYGCGFGRHGSLRCQAIAAIGYARTAHATTADTLLVGGASRQGDSGGGVFDVEGRLVAVIWGTDERRTMATTLRRIRRFLRSILPLRRRQPRTAPSPPADALPDPALERPNAAQRGTNRQILALADQLEQLRRQISAGTQHAQGAQRSSTARLDRLAAALAAIQERLATGERLAKGAAAATVVRPTEWLVPLICGALGISVPPTAALLALRVARCWLRRRLRKRNRRRRSVDDVVNRRPKPNAAAAAAAPRWNDDYAEQLHSVMEYSGGRTAAQDATLGREYDRELRQAAAASGHGEVVDFANKVLDRVARRFGRIHADNPVPSTPVSDSA